MLARPFGRFNPSTEIRYVNLDENTKYPTCYLWWTGQESHDDYTIIDVLQPVGGEIYDQRTPGRWGINKSGRGWKTGFFSGSDVKQMGSAKSMNMRSS